MAADNRVNSTLEARREAREAEQMMTESVNRMTEVASNCMEIGQKQLALCSSMFHFWGDCYNSAQSAMDRMVGQTHRMSDQMRKA